MSLRLKIVRTERVKKSSLVLKIEQQLMMRMIWMDYIESSQSSFVEMVLWSSGWMAVTQPGLFDDMQRS
jgi:hypothetical protein